MLLLFRERNVDWRRERELEERKKKVNVHAQSINYKSPVHS